MKIIKLNLSDIILDRKNAANILNRNCFEDERKYVAGAFLKGDNLFVWLEKVNIGDESNYDSYVFSQLDDPGEEAMIGEIQNRSAFGFATVTFFEIDDKLWGLFARKR
ncbi:MAG: hypothetical protein K9M56_00280 [Victivallales bacterium]|nr:hypothetical protein [Victivallales bacterium]